jgi:cytidylate kinase
MIIVIGGKAGAGKSTIAKELAKKLDLKHHSMGDLQRQIAEKRGISLSELSKLEEQDSTIDKELDQKQKELAENEDNFVIDGRLCVFFMPNADFKIFLEAEEETRAKRILKDNRNGEKAENEKELTEKLQQREQSEIKRFKEYYHLDCYDKSKYDTVIDTTNLTIENIVSQINKLIKQTLVAKSLEKQK